jgi:hypothetical protein
MSQEIPNFIFDQYACASGAGDFSSSLGSCRMIALQHKEILDSFRTLFSPNVQSIFLTRVI